MIEPILWGLWGVWIVQSLASAVNVILYESRRRAQDRRHLPAGPDTEQPVALIVSVKGFDEKLTPKFFEALLTQDYSSYRVIVTVEDANEPTLAWLRKELEMSPLALTWRPSHRIRGVQEVVLVVAGEASECGQKVHNQIAAFKELADGDEIVAFADADIECDNTWLSRLTAPLNLGTHGVSTTYRWLVPQKSSMANFFASVVNSSVATLSGPELWNFTWGGSMALTREVFRDLDVPELFAGCLNDDLRLGKAARRRGYRISMIRSLLIPSPIRHSWRSFFEFGRRQYYQVKHFVPRLFVIALFLTWLYVLGIGSALAAVMLGNFYAWIPIAVVTIFDQTRAIARARIIHNLYGGKTEKILDDSAWVEHLFTPFWMALHCAIVTSALFAKKITWAGITYRIGRRGKTEILSRAGSIAIPEPSSEKPAEKKPELVEKKTAEKEKPKTEEPPKTEGENPKPKRDLPETKPKTDEKSKPGDKTKTDKKSKKKEEVVSEKLESKGSEEPKPEEEKKKAGEKSEAKSKDEKEAEDEAKTEKKRKAGESEKSGERSPESSKKSSSKEDKESDVQAENVEKSEIISERAEDEADPESKEKEDSEKVDDAKSEDKKAEDDDDWENLTPAERNRRWSGID